MIYMLTTLPSTDLLLCTPDAEGIQLFGDSFSWEQVPKGVGCYAFYHPETGDTWYVGSACATSQEAASCGVRARLRCYRGRGERDNPTKTVLSMRHACREHGLLLRVWIAGSEGDARKYEADAIAIHGPRLNIHGNRRMTSEEHRLRRNTYARNSARRKPPQSYDGKAMKTCSRCNVSKPCSSFHRHMYTRLGVCAWCRACTCEDRRLKREALTIAPAPQLS